MIWYRELYRNRSIINNDYIEVFKNNGIARYNYCSIMKDNKLEISSNLTVEI